MSAIDKFNEFNRTVIAFRDCEWFMQPGSVRMFWPGRDTSERAITDADRTIFNNAASVTEHEFSSAVSFHGSAVLGKALQSICLRMMEKQLKKLAEEAKAEALAVMEALK